MSEAQRHAGSGRRGPCWVWHIAHMLDHVGRVSSGKPVLVFVHLYLKSEEPVKKLVMYYAIYFTMLPLNNKNKFLRVTHTCSKIIGLPTPSLPALINTATIYKSYIAHDPRHPLHPYFTLLPSGRRFRHLSCRTTRFCKSFIPSAITALNSRR